jgi:NifB/MoaA-like Fe-S oxidoreductase
LVALIALNEEEEVYESNVLVIVRNKDSETVKEILRIKREVEREYGEKIVISPFIAREDEASIMMHSKKTPRAGN